MRAEDVVQTSDRYVSPFGCKEGETIYGVFYVLSWKRQFAQYVVYIELGCVIDMTQIAHAPSLQTDDKVLVNS